MPIQPPWLRGRLHATNTLPCTTVFVSTHNFPPFTTADKCWNDANRIRSDRMLLNKHFSDVKMCANFMRDCDISDVFVSLCPCRQHGKGGLASLHRGKVFLTCMASTSGLVTGWWSALPQASYENRQRNDMLPLTTRNVRSAATRPSAVALYRNKCSGCCRVHKGNDRFDCPVRWS